MGMSFVFEKSISTAAAAGQAKETHAKKRKDARFRDDVEAQIVDVESGHVRAVRRPDIDALILRGQKAAAALLDPFRSPFEEPSV